MDIRVSGSRALGLYVGLAAIFFGIRLLEYPGETYLGYGSDPEIFVWAFAWWPHAIAHGLNPFVTDALWTPTGVNLTWTTSTPALALLFAPVTWLIGPLGAYNVAAVLMPALAAWTAFLLCRHVTRAAWPSLVGGYLFGFSSYMLGQTEGHLHMTATFLVPLAALLVLWFLEGDLEGRGLVLRLGPLIAFQVGCSTELAFTLTLCLFATLVVVFALARASRVRIRRLVAPLAASYGFAALLLAPFLYYLLRGFERRAFQPPELYVADLLQLVIPTQLSLSGAGWAGAFTAAFPGGNASERGAYIGVAALGIVWLFAVRERNTVRGKVLTVLFGLGVLASLGGTLWVWGHRTGVPLPWRAVIDLPLFNNTLPVRFALFTSLVTALMVAMWAAGSRLPRIVRVGLPMLAVALTLPNPAARVWATTIDIPRFLTAPEYRPCLAPDEIVLPLPASGEGNQMTWQAVSDFRFRMAGGHIAANPPLAFMRDASLAAIGREGQVIQDPQIVRDYLEKTGATVILVDLDVDWKWRPVLDQIAAGRLVGGMLVYRPDGVFPAGCPAS